MRPVNNSKKKIGQTYSCGDQNVEELESDIASAIDNKMSLR